MTDKIEVPFIPGQNFVRAFNDTTSLLDFLDSREAKPGIFVMLHGWPHVVVDDGDHGKKAAAMKPPYSVSFVY